MHRSSKLLGLIAALTVGVLQSAPSAFADSPSSLFLAECQRPKQQATAQLVNHDGRLVTQLQVFNGVTVYREYPIPCAAGFQIKPLPIFRPPIFDILKTEIVFEFPDSKEGGEPGIHMTFRYKGQTGADKYVLFTTDIKKKEEFHLVRNSDGTYTGTVKSFPILAKGVPANAEITFVSLVFQPTIPRQAKRKIFVRSVKFLNEDVAPDINAGVGGCELLGDPASIFDF